jgi:homoserine acetyltransferase
VAAAADSAAPPLQSFTLDLPLQCGRVLRGATIRYHTRGALAAAKDNVILHPTSFDATSSDLMYNVGPGKLLDTDKYHGARAAPLPQMPAAGAQTPRRTPH